jgi:hypothetical protein
MVGMCMMCDGYSADEVNQWYEMAIAVHGWAISGVEDEHLTPWAYTIGLVEGFDHPELIVVGMSWKGANRALNELGAQILGGSRFDERSVAEVGDHLFPFGPVDPEQFEHEGFNGWTDFYERWKREFVPRVALQVFPPPCLVSAGGDPDDWRLDTPAEVLGDSRPRNAPRPR